MKVHYRGEVGLAAVVEHAAHVAVEGGVDGVLAACPALARGVLPVHVVQVEDPGRRKVRLPLLRPLPRHQLPDVLAHQLGPVTRTKAQSQW